MERKSKLSLSLTLSIIAMLIVFGLAGKVNAPPPNPGYPQQEAFDSSPTAATYAGIGTPTGAIANAYDGDLGTNVNFQYGASASGFVEVTGFHKPSDFAKPDFVITYVDVKVCYKAGATSTTDDRYRIVTYLDPSATNVTLQDWVTYPAAIYPPSGFATTNPGTIRPWSALKKPPDYVPQTPWTWDEITTKLRLRIETNQVGTNNFQRFYLHEVYLTVYSTPYPGASTLSVQAPYIAGVASGGEFFVDIYVTNVVKLWGYQIMLRFDPNYLVGLEFVSYGPFTSSLPSEIGADYFAVAYKTFDGDPVGFTGNGPIVRLYFGVGADGECGLTLDRDITTLSDILGGPIFLTMQDGYWNSQFPEFPLGLGIVMLLAPAIPVVYLWRLRKKERA